MFASQLALAQLHPRLAPVKPVPGGYMLDAELTRTWFELPAQRGFAGYGLARALRILLDVLSGLAALHDTKIEAGTGFVHGEVVPAMLRVDRQGCGRLVPLAPWHRLEAGAAAAPERQGHLAPERLLGDAIDQRADVFSCGVLLWEALAGRRLFDADSVDAIVMRLMGGKVQLPELPPELSWATPLKAVAMCALAVDPGQRFSDCAELALAIEDAVAGHVASHEEVAEFFGARERASMLPPAAPALAASHNSSLSALVSPALPREEREARAARQALAERDAQAPSEPPESTATSSSGARRLWVAAALLSLFAALGWGARNRSWIAQHAAGGTPNGVDLRPAAQPSNSPSGSAAPPEPAQSAASELSAPVAPASASAEPLPASPHLDTHPGKAHPAAAKSKPAIPGAHPAAPKTGPVRDKAADQYGI